MSLNVTLAAQLEEFVHAKVAQGEYASPSELLGEAVRLLQSRDELWKAGVREKIERGMASCREGRTVSSRDAWAALDAWRRERKARLSS